MVRWLRWHSPPDTGFEIRALAVWGRARYLSVTEAPHNTDFCVYRTLYQARVAGINRILTNSGFGANRNEEIDTLTWLISGGTGIHGIWYRYTALVLPRPFSHCYAYTPSHMSFIWIWHCWRNCQLQMNEKYPTFANRTWCSLYHWCFINFKTCTFNQ